MESGRKVKGAIRFLLNAGSLRLECRRPGLINGCETVVWRENEKFRINALEMDIFRSLPGIMRVYRMANSQSRDLYDVKKSG